MTSRRNFALLFRDATEYPLLMRVAAKLFLDGWTEARFAEEFGRTEVVPARPFKSPEHERLGRDEARSEPERRRKREYATLSEATLVTVQNYIRDFERGQSAMTPRLRQLAEEVRL